MIRWKKDRISIEKTIVSFPPTSILVSSTSNRGERVIFPMLIDRRESNDKDAITIGISRS